MSDKQLWETFKGSEVRGLRRKIADHRRDMEELANDLETLENLLALAEGQTYEDSLADFAFDERKDGR